MTGTEAVFAAVVADRGPRMVALAALLTRDRALAEDLVQDCLLRAYLRWERAGAPDHPEAYLRQAVVHACASARRRKRVEPHRLLVGEADPRRPEDELAERDLLWRALGTLSPRQRTVLVLRYYEDLPDAEIAAAMGCARVTVRGLAARGLAALRTDPAVARLVAGDGDLDDRTTGRLS